MTRLYPYQKKGVKLLEHFDGRALLADQMGLGKTIQSLVWLKKHPERRPAIIICPASLKYNWQREAEVHTGIRAAVLEGTTVDARPDIMGEGVYIINYDILKSWLPWLIRLRPKVVIADEIHYCKSLKAKRTAYVKELCRKVPYVIGMSGTPLTNRPKELWPILNIIRPDIFHSFHPFGLKFCNPKKVRGKWDFSGASNLRQLHRILKANLMIRRTKSQVLDQLPSKTRTVVPVKLKDFHEYEEARDMTYHWIMKRHGKLKARKALKSLALVKVGYLKRLAAQLKFHNVIQWIKDFLASTDEKLVVFAVHRSNIELLQKEFKNSVTIYGSTKRGRTRQALVDKFQNDPKTRLFIGSLQAAGVGITLTESSTVLFAEMGWTPGEHTQAEDRLHRIGQNNPVQCIYMVGIDTIEERICSILQEKQKNLDSVLDGKVDHPELNIFDILLEEIIKGGSL